MITKTVIGKQDAKKLRSVADINAIKAAVPVVGVVVEVS